MKVNAVSTFMVGLILAFACIYLPAQDATLKPANGSTKLKAGFKEDPYTKEVTAGGGGKIGKARILAYMNKEPHFVLDYEAGKYVLTIYAESKVDTTLLVLTPDGEWLANDDGPGTGQNPLLRFANPKSGKYTIWVGTLDKAPAPAVLKITEKKVGK